MTEKQNQNNGFEEMTKNLENKPNAGILSPEKHKIVWFMLVVCLFTVTTGLVISILDKNTPKLVGADASFIIWYSVGVACLFIGWAFIVVDTLALLGMVTKPKHFDILSALTMWILVLIFVGFSCYFMSKGGAEVVPIVAIIFAFITLITQFVVGKISKK